MKNLKEVSDARIMGEFTTSLPPWIVGLIAFGGNNPLSNVVVPSTFEVGLLKQQCSNLITKMSAEERMEFKRKLERMEKRRSHQQKVSQCFLISPAQSLPQLQRNSQLLKGLGREQLETLMRQ